MNAKCLCINKDRKTWKSALKSQDRDNNNNNNSFHVEHIPLEYHNFVASLRLFIKVYSCALSQLIFNSTLKNRDIVLMSSFTILLNLTVCNKFTYAFNRIRLIHRNSKLLSFIAFHFSICSLTRMYIPYLDIS